VCAPRENDTFYVGIEYTHPSLLGLSVAEASPANHSSLVARFDAG
jgi:hypothetical protein